VLLKREILVDSYEDVELGLRQRQKLAIRNARPPLAQDGLCVETRDVRRESSVNTLIEQDPQAAAVTARSAAFSRNCTT